MNWFVKALIYATVLTWPGHLVAPAYQSLLLGLTGTLLGATLAPPPDGSVDLSASNVLTILVALCLASDFAPWRHRVRAALAGIVLLIAIECATGALGIRLAEHGASGLAQSAPWEIAAARGLELSRWLAVPLIWGLLLGRLLARRPTT